VLIIIIIIVIVTFTVTFTVQCVFIIMTVVKSRKVKGVQKLRGDNYVKRVQK
jgi:hypothetical protein